MKILLMCLFCMIPLTCVGNENEQQPKDAVVIFGSKNCGPCQQLKQVVFDQNTYNVVKKRYRVFYVSIDNEDGRKYFQAYQRVLTTSNVSVPQTFVLKYEEKNKRFVIAKDRSGRILHRIGSMTRKTLLKFLNLVRN